MKSKVALLTLVAALGIASAAVPPPEQLLPQDTLAVLTFPDWGKVSQTRKESPMMRLWDDPAMRPFREKLLGKLAKEVIEPLEGELGIKLTNYTSIPQGQVTVALTQNGWSGKQDPLPALLVLVDAKEKQDLLKTQLGEVRKRLADKGKPTKTEKVRDVEFTTVVLDLEHLGATEGAKESETSKDQAIEKTEGSGAPKVNLSFGQAGSLLLLGTSTADLERVLARLSGGSAPCLAEQTAYESDHKALFRDSLCHGWAHFAPVGEILTKVVAEESAKEQNPNPMGGPPPDKVLGALGLSSLRTLAFSVRENSEGAFVEFFMGVPEEKVKGLFRLLSTAAKEARPQPFVPADAIEFSRWRLDGQKVWASIEAIVNEISPGMMGFLTAQLETALKEKDPNIDLRKNFIGNLGDDLVIYQKAPKGTSFEDLNSAPSLFLLGSPNAEQLLQTLRSILGMLPGPLAAGEVKEREFLGRKIYSIALPTMPAPGASQPKERSLSLAASGGYVAFTTDSAMIEEYLRTGDSRPKPLSEVAGLQEAAQKVGGMETGLFGYQNDVENMRALIEALRNNPDFIQQTLAFTPLAARPDSAQKLKEIRDWVDFALLPPFEKLAKYFYMTVYSGQTTPRGFSLKMFSPRPPTLR